MCALSPWPLEPCQGSLSVQHTVSNDETNQKLSSCVYACVETKIPKQVNMTHFSACPMSNINHSVRLYVQIGSTVVLPQGY